ncbi:MAG: right-handed parallel beta-helix repeat-containing protein [Candidatus Paceibacterota bacterium]
MKKLLLVLVLLSLAGLASATDFNTCAYLINSSGTYRLTGNLACTGHGISVNNAVTGVVIDLNGKTVSGDEGVGDYGIRLLSGASQVTIENGTVIDFGRGINLATGDHNIIVIRNVTISSNANGIYSSSSGAATGYLIQNNTITAGTADGITLEVSSGTPSVGNNTVTGNVVTSNGGNGQIVLGNLFQANVTFNNITGAKTGLALWTTSAGFVNATGNLFYNITQASESAVWIQTVSNTSVFADNLFFNDTKPITSDVASNWTNTTIGVSSASSGKATWPSFNLTAGNALAIGTNMYVASDYISINSSALPALNTSAAIQLLTDASCLNRTIFTASGFPAARADILSGSKSGIVSSCTSGTAQFSVSGFSGYTTGLSSISAAQNSPAEAAVITATRSATFNWTCSGDFAAYLSNLTIDGVLNVSSIASANDTAAAQTVDNFVDGAHNWSVKCWNETAIATSATRNFTINNSLSVTLDAPADGINSTSSSQDFKWTASGGFAAYLSNLTIDGVLNVSSIASANNTQATQAISGLSLGQHNWSVASWNGTEIVTSANRTFTVRPYVVSPSDGANITTNPVQLQLDSPVAFTSPCLWEINGTNYTGTILAGNLNCTYNLSPAHNTTYTVRPFVNSSGGMIQANETSRSFTWYNASLCPVLVDVLNITQNTSSYLTLNDTIMYVVAANITLNNTCPAAFTSVEYDLSDGVADSTWTAYLISMSALEVKNFSDFSFRIPLAGYDDGENGGYPFFSKTNNHKYHFNTTYTRNITQMRVNLTALGDYRDLFKCESTDCSFVSAYWSGPLSISTSGGRILRIGDILPAYNGSMLSYVVSYQLAAPPAEGGGGGGGGPDTTIIIQNITVEDDLEPTFEERTPQVTSFFDGIVDFFKKKLSLPFLNVSITLALVFAVLLIIALLVRHYATEAPADGIDVIVLICVIAMVLQFRDFIFVVI